LESSAAQSINDTTEDNSLASLSQDSVDGGETFSENVESSEGETLDLSSQLDENAFQDFEVESLTQDLPDDLDLSSDPQSSLSKDSQDSPIDDTFGSEETEETEEPGEFQVEKGAVFAQADSKEQENESPVEESPVEENPVEESLVKESPVEESFVKESPVEASSLEDSIVEDIPVEDKSGEELQDKDLEEEKPEVELHANNQEGVPQESKVLEFKPENRETVSSDESLNKVDDESLNKVDDESVIEREAPEIPEVLSVKAQEPVAQGDPNFDSAKPLESKDIVEGEPLDVLNEETKDIQTSKEGALGLDSQKFTDVNIGDISLDDLSLDSGSRAADFDPESSIAKLPPEADVYSDDDEKYDSTLGDEEQPLELSEKVKPGESHITEPQLTNVPNADIKLAYPDAQESDYLEANSDYVGIGAESVSTHGEVLLEEKAPFEKLEHKAEIDSPYKGTRQGGKVQAESSTAVIVNYLDDKEDSPIIAQGDYGALGAEEDLDLDLLELNNPPSFEAKPMIPVPRTPR
jgi:hypothetical protein